MMSINQEISEEPQNKSSEIVLCVNGVSKKFCRDLKRSLLYGVQDIASEVLGIREKSKNLRSKEFWALQDVSFQLGRGESIGLVGKNGSGKSTLLRIIAGLIKPDTGSVEINGRVAPLIALGAGFNPILTGRENIYANMSILGLSKKEIDERFDAVVDFAEIGDAIDSPVQTYSSGMAARLGFASAIHTEPEILLLDEVLAVGDAKFRTKCYRKLSELREKGTSFVLVTHNSPTIQANCEKAIWLSNGKLLAKGNAISVSHKYEEYLFAQKVEQSSGVMHLPEKPESQSLGIGITSVYFKDDKGKLLQSPLSGESVHLCVKCKVYKEINDLALTVFVYERGGEGERALDLNNFRDNKLFKIMPGDVELQLQMPYCGLKPGFYNMKISIGQMPYKVLDMVESFPFQVQSNDYSYRYLYYQPRDWQVINI